MPFIRSNFDASNHGGPPPTAASTSTTRESIVEKLHGALASMRRECDDYHRRKELESERVRLIKEEHEATQKSVLNLQEQLAKISNIEQVKKEVEQAERKVAFSRKEFQFQHAELLTKRGRVEDMKTQVVDVEAKAREERRQMMHDKIRQSRQNFADRDMNPYLDLELLQRNSEQQVALLEKFLPKVANWVQKCAAGQTEIADEFHYRGQESENIIEAYKIRFGDHDLIDDQSIMGNESSA